MRELVLIFPDLYLHEQERPALAASLPGLEELLRFATREALPGGWRAWLCHRVGRADLAVFAPAALAAGADGSAVPVGARLGRLWLAEPVHLQAGLTRVQLARDGLLRLTPSEAQSLAADFGATFGASGLALQPLRAGSFLLHGLEAEALTEDPARHLGADISEALPRGAAAAAVRRLSSEIELWLHAHPVNRERARARVHAVSSLWIWGGSEARGRESQRPLPAGFGDDASFAGLWQLCGQETRALPDELTALAADRAAEAVAVVGHASGASGLDLDALERHWFAPAAARLGRGELAMLTLVLNDFVFHLRPRDRWRRWRPRLRWTERLR